MLQISPRACQSVLGVALEHISTVSQRADHLHCLGQCAGRGSTALLTLVTTNCKQLMMISSIISRKKVNCKLENLVEKSSCNQSVRRLAYKKSNLLENVVTVIAVSFPQIVYMLLCFAHVTQLPYLNRLFSCPEFLNFPFASEVYRLKFVSFFLKNIARDWLDKEHKKFHHILTKYTN